MPALLASQYADDRNLRARQHLWDFQDPPFDIVGWVLDLAGVAPGPEFSTLDVGCGNGAYLRAMQARRINAVGCDLSVGMLHSAASNPKLINANVTHLPFRAAAFDAVLAPHMLYHVSDRKTAAFELRRVLKPEGVCIVVTNGQSHMRALRDLVEAAARLGTPGWEMKNPSTHEFSLENGEVQLRNAFSPSPAFARNAWGSYAFKTPTSRPTTWPASPTNTKMRSRSRGRTS